MSSGAMAQALEEMPLIGRLMKKAEAKGGIPMPPPQYRADAKDLPELPEIKQAPPEPQAIPTQEDVMAAAFKVTHQNQEAIYAAHQDTSEYLKLMMQEIVSLKSEILKLMMQEIVSLKSEILNVRQNVMDLQSKKK